jgi:acid phosphatase
MHGASGCQNSNTIRSGDDWLKANLPAMIDYSNAHRGVIFVVFDEGSATLTLPFIAIGPGVKKGYVGGVQYTHRSLIKSVERIFGLPLLAKVAGDDDFADLFESGRFP